MTLSYRVLIFTIISTAIWGCAPTDQHVLPFQERLEKGEPIIYNSVGDQPAGCHNKEWTDVRLSQKEIETLFYFKGNISVGYGMDNCLRVGESVVIKNMDNNNKLVDGPAKAQVVRIIIWKTSKATRALQDSLKFTIDGPNTGRKRQVEEYLGNEFWGAINAKASDTRTGVIHITQLRYVEGSSTQVSESQFGEAGKLRFEDSFSYPKQTSEENPVLSNCRSTWTDLRVTPEYWNMMKSGAIGTGWQVMKGPVCLTQGATVPVNDRASGAELGSVQVGIIRQMKKDQLKPEHLILIPNGKSFDQAKSEIQQLFRDPNTEFLNLYDFTVTEVIQ